MKIKKNLDVLLYEKIKDGFLKCEYKLGEKIDIDQLAEKYEVSRTPIIQAIKRLENEGMMETGRGGKVSIPRYDAKKICDVYNVRILLEQYAMRCICEQGIRKDFSKMRTYADECDAGYATGDIVMASKADLNFHKAIIKQANNACLSSVYSKVQGQCMVVNYLLSSTPKDHQESCKRDHREIIDSLENFELDKTCSLLENHLKRNVQRLLEILPYVEQAEE